MNSDFDMDLKGMFAEMPEPGDGERFVEKTGARIARRRFGRRLLGIVLVILTVLLIAASILRPTGLNAYLIGWPQTVAIRISTAALSPAGMAVGGWLGLLVFVKLRLFGRGFALKN
jgi:hypothetical protein